MMSKPVRLLVLTHNYPRSGDDYAGVFVHLLCRRLVQNDIEPVVLAPHDAGAAEYEEIDGIKVYRFRYASRDEDENIAYRGQMHKLVTGSVGGALRFKRFLDAFKSAAFETIARERINVIAGHWLVPAGLVMRTIARKTELPMILSSHGTDIRLMSKYFGLPYKYLRKLVFQLNAWTVVSSFLKNEMVRLDSNLQDRITVLPLPHDENLFDRDPLVKKDPNLIVSVTRYTEQKRVDYLVKAFSKARLFFPEARLEIFGEGPEQSEIEALIKQLGLPECVSIHKPVPQEVLREIYNRASVVVLNSYREGFGLTLSEAMLCGTAVIGTNSGGIPDIIEHNRRGLLVEPDDVLSLAEAMQLLLKDSDLRERLAGEGYRFAHDNYASSALAKRYADIVRKACET